MENCARKCRTLHREDKAEGLRLVAGKNKSMMSDAEKIKIPVETDGVNIERLDEFVYLGNLLT